MAERFDPYYTWLGIPPEEQPANHYRLLGVKALEENLDAIEHAADRQMAHLRTFQSGKHSNDSQKLLNEVATAKVTLLNPEKKAEYDRSVRHKLKPGAAPKEKPAKAVSLPVADPLSEDSIPRPDFSKEKPATEAPARASAGKQQTLIAAAVGGGVFLLLVIAFFVWRASGPKDGTAGELASGDGSAAQQPDELPKPPGPKNPPPPPEGPSTPVGPVEPAVPETPPEPEFPPAGTSWTDMLEHVDIERDANLGQWTRNGSEVTGTCGEIARLVSPVEMQGSYDLHAEFTRTAGNDSLVFTLPVGDTQCNLLLTAMGTGTCGLSQIKGGFRKIPMPAPMENDVRHVVLARVAQEGDNVDIRATLDGEPLLHWNGPQSSLRRGVKFYTDKRNRLGLIFSSATVTYHLVRVRPNPGDSPLVASVEPPAETPVVTPPVVAPPVETAPVETPIVKAPKPVKHPVPSPEKQKQVLADLEELYEFSKAKTSEEKIKLAKELLELGSDPSQIPGERFVMLRKAIDLAREAGDAQVMFAAVDAMETANIEVNVLDAKASVFAQFAENAREPATIKSLMDNTPPLVEQAIAQKRYDVAYDVVKAAHGVSGRPAGLQYRRELADKLKELEKLKDQLDAIKRAEASLQTSPDDPATNLMVGRWYCFDKGEWDRGLPHLAKGSDSQLSQAANQELKPPVDPEAMVAVGDIWWGMAEEAPEDQKKNLYARAGHWYHKAQGNLAGGLTKIKVEKRLEQLAKIDPVMAAEMGVVEPGSPLLVGRWVDVLQFVPADAGWKREGDALVLRGVKEGARTLPVVFNGNYDLQVDYTRENGDYSVGIALPVGDRQGSVGLDYQGTSGLGVDGERFYRNSTSQKHAWELGKRYSILSKVRTNGENVTIDVLRDGEPLFSWSGNLASLEARRSTERGTPNTPRLRFSRTDGIFHAARARLVSGTAVMLDAEGKIPDVAAKPTPGRGSTPGTKPPADTFAFVPSSGLEKNKQGGWSLTRESHRLSLSKPLTAPWTLDFDFMLPTRKRGLNVIFGRGAKGYLTLTIYADYYCAIRWRKTNGGDKAYIARLPEKAAAMIRAGQPYHARLEVAGGAVRLLLNGATAFQARDPRVTPGGTITISGNPAIVGNPKIQTVSAAPAPRRKK